MNSKLKKLLLSLTFFIAFIVSSSAQTNYQKAIKSAYIEDLMMKKGLVVLKDWHKKLDALTKADKSIPQLNYWLRLA